MAYAESTIGGTSGTQFRCWVNSIRTYDGSAAENFEDWRVEGGINRVVSGSRVWNNFNNSTYTIQLGINGMATSGAFSYDAPSGWTGGLKAWGSGTTRAYRNSAGVGFGFTSRTDVNMSNSPYLTSGWVQSSDSVQTRYRHATLTSLSMDAGGVPATDEGPMWLEFSNPAGAAVDAFLETPSRIFTSPSGIGSRYNFTFNTALKNAMQQSIPNSNTGTLRIGIHDALGGDNWDYRDRTYTIKNDTGQANPTFSDFTYLDTNSTTTAVTGNNQILIQGKSTLEATVSVANKATANKYATMSSYNFTIGSYSQNEPWSDVASVVKNIGVVSDVSGSQNLGVRAIDSRGNSKTVTKNITILPYASPGFYNGLDVKYANDFDVDDGLSVTLFNNSVLGLISPMTLGVSDINVLSTTSGANYALRYDIAKDTGLYSGTWTEIPFTQEAGTGYITVDPAWLATSIETRMNSLTADNTVRWFILFEIKDKLETQYVTVTIDVGRPFFRIGADGRLYYKEIEFFQTFSGRANLYYSALLAKSTNGTWTHSPPAAARPGGWAMYVNSTSAAINNQCYVDIYVPAGTYSLTFFFDGSTASGQIELNLDNQVTFSTAFETYVATAAEVSGTTSNLNFLDGATYRMYFKVTGKHASSTSYQCRLLGIRLNRV